MTSAALFYWESCTPQLLVAKIQLFSLELLVTWMSLCGSNSGSTLIHVQKWVYCVLPLMDQIASCSEKGQRSRPACWVRTPNDIKSVHFVIKYKCIYAMQSKPLTKCLLLHWKCHRFTLACSTWNHEKGNLTFLKRRATTIPQQEGKRSFLYV